MSEMISFILILSNNNYSLCRERDLNPHAHNEHRPSTCRVYQFRHLGKFQIDNLTFKQNTSFCPSKINIKFLRTSLLNLCLNA